MNEFDAMLQLFVDGAFGKKTDFAEVLDTAKILRLAQEHNIYYSVLEALLSSNVGFDEEERVKQENILKNIQLSSYYKYFKYAELLKVFEESNIPYALLKGYCVARYYKNPYTRLSGDTDVLINKEDEKKALKILKQYGFELIELSTSEMKHSVLNHPQLGVLELHIALYNKKTQKLWFEDDKASWEVSLSFSKLEKIQFDDMYYYALPADENIMFLFEHIVKHFIYEGTSIRTFVDFCFAYINESFDYDLFYHRICEKGYQTIFNAILATVKRYMGDDCIQFPHSEKEDEELVSTLLKDMEKGKWLGSAMGAGEATALANKLSARIQADKQCKIVSVFKKIFPEIRALRNNYGYSMKHPALVPVAWLHRLLRFLFGKSTLNSERENSDHLERIDFLEKFDLI